MLKFKWSSTRKNKFYEFLLRKKDEANYSGNIEGYILVLGRANYYKKHIIEPKLN